MRRKQATQHLDQRHHVMLENAFYMVSFILRSVDSAAETRF